MGAFLTEIIGNTSTYDRTMLKAVKNKNCYFLEKGKKKITTRKTETDRVKHLAKLALGIQNLLATNGFLN